MDSEAVRHTYAAAGVNIDIAAKAKELIGKQARTTHRPEVLGGVGFFGGLFEFKGYKQPVLVSSVDGVGTKLKIAIALGRHDTVGIDLVNHCVNDILTCGAEPLFFLDYIAMGKLVPEQVSDIATGMAQACKEVGCALIGGETAEMPGLYSGQDYDLVGFVIGVVEKDKIINGRTIEAGDAVVGLPSSGLHTNGYSLVRNIFSIGQMSKNYPELGRRLGEELLEPHRCYYNQLKPQLSLVKGMAHITGGGLVDNIPRVLPEGLAVHLDRKSWAVPPIFKLIQDKGNVERGEMFRVFNMGIGMVIICAPDNVSGLIGQLSEDSVIGEVVQQVGKERVVID
ncbi:MAG: phosphoribosylformylglycinamidine cyclo-ligase [Chloroflexi bacterium]|nr:phosphoribosylformylglycinamidine cyclo-ligase [Chloroflexota bacterium]